ncbi:MAG: hypothetical protein ABJB86_17040 [Bacteroidota bacterium]
MPWNFSGRYFTPFEAVTHYNCIATQISYQLFGEGKEITLLQMTARSATMFLSHFFHRGLEVRAFLVSLFQKDN